MTTTLITKTLALLAVTALAACVNAPLPPSCDETPAASDDAAPPADAAPEAAAVADADRPADDAPAPLNSCQRSVCDDGGCHVEVLPNDTDCREGDRPGICQQGRCVTCGLVPGFPCCDDDSCGVPSLTCVAATHRCDRCGGEWQLPCRLGAIVGDGSNRTPSCYPWLRYDASIDRCVATDAPVAACRPLICGDSGCVRGLLPEGSACNETGQDGVCVSGRCVQCGYTVGASCCADGGCATGLSCSDEGTCQ